MESKMEVQPKRNYPPRVGEWSYWIINIEGREEDMVGCHYSMKEPNEQPFISCLGKITAVKYMVKGQIHY